MMASSLAVCRLHMAWRLQKLDKFMYRSVRTHVGAAQAEVNRREDGGQSTELSNAKYEKGNGKGKDAPKPFYLVLAERREQAKKSVLINVPPNTNAKTFLQYIATYGHVKKYFFYESNSTYAVVEFSSLESVASILAQAALPSDTALPLKSRLLSLTTHGLVDSSQKPTRLEKMRQTTPTIDSLIQRLSLEKSMDNQIIHLTETHQLTESNTRLRFLVCSLLEDIAGAYFPECTIKLFGSSVNGFGKLGCDLDMFLDLDSISGRNTKMPDSGFSLEYQMKRADLERTMTQSILSVIGESVDKFGPGCVGVQKILKARCPLVRFAHLPSGFQCDLTANNRVAVKSSELLYLYGLVDPRVRYLVFTLRCWARAQGITSSIPGAWITNFSLTVMTLFFLQKRSRPIIPTLEQLRDLADPADKCLIDDNDCTFVSNLSKIPKHSNMETLEQLLCDFFEFYATFPFHRMSINIRKGQEQIKPGTEPLHIENPFETSLNISKNVNTTQLNRFVTLCQETSWLLSQSEMKTLGQQEKNKKAPAAWGLAGLLKPQLISRFTRGKSKRQEGTIERIKDLLQNIKSKSQ